MLNDFGGVIELLIINISLNAGPAVALLLSFGRTLEQDRRAIK